MNDNAKRISWVVRMVVLGLAVFSATGCDSNSSRDKVDDEQETSPLSVATQAVISNGVMEVWLEKRGILSAQTTDKFTGTKVSALSLAGPWLFSNQDKPRANIVSSILFLSNLVLSKARDFTPAGIFTLTRDSLLTPVSNWPIEVGAPSLPDGQPRLYGDMMAWAHYRSVEGSNENIGSALVSPDFLTDIEIGMSVYLFNDESVKNAFFIRFDIQNAGSAQSTI